MKKLILVSIIFLAANVLQANSFHFRSGVNIDYFYSSLSPHGEWIEIDHDVIVWRPSYVRHSWRPYSEGSWLWTSDGWYWDSYEPFGWATYHYGRWFLDDFYGWVWMPDYEWAPAWVEWRYNDNYIGWAPLPPYASFHTDFGIRFSIGWHSRHNYWNFVGYNHFGHRDVNVYIVDNSTNINIYNNTKYRTNYRYKDGRIINGGVERNFVERRSGYRIAERNINNTSDYSTYKSRNTNDSRSVTVFRPSDSDVEKSRGIERKDIVRGSGKSNLEVSKVTRSNENRSTVSRDDRNTEVKKETTVKSGRHLETTKSGNIRKETKVESKDVKRNIETQKSKIEKPAAKSSRKSDSQGVKKESKSKSFNKDLSSNRKPDYKSAKPKTNKKADVLKKQSSSKSKSLSKPSAKSKIESKAAAKKTEARKKVEKSKR